MEKEEEKEFIKKRILENEELFNKKEFEKIVDELEKSDIMYVMYKIRLYRWQ